MKTQLSKEELIKKVSNSQNCLGWERSLVTYQDSFICINIV